MADLVLHVAPDPARSPVEEGLMFEDFFEREKVKLFRALCLMTRDRPLAEELTQDAFVNVLERWEQVGSLEDPTGYLYRTAMNVFRSWHRRALLAAKRTLRVEPGEDAMAAIEAEDAVMRALSPLPPRQRAAVVLVDLLGYSSEEAGRMLGIRAGTVRTHVARAHEELKRWVGAR
jgi:RNA polymerase sigma factor (sigma-70 family)